ncbi:MAG: T9SS type A sorting domain-containing protein [Bacteroidota bacterium]
MKAVQANNNLPATQFSYERSNRNSLRRRTVIFHVRRINISLIPKWILQSMQYLNTKSFITSALTWGCLIINWPLHLAANNCNSAVNLTLGSSSSVAFDASCEFGPGSQDPCGGACTGDAWFEWVPGGTNLSQFNVQFDISLNVSATVNIMLLYSESKELGDPCEWPSSAEGYTRYQHMCGVVMTPGNVEEITAEGLDGSGTFFILVERVSGGTGSVTVNPTFLGNCAAPSNDRCTNPIALTVGNGIDPSVTTGPAIPNWMNALCGSTACATKQRLTTGCTFAGNGASTEDHYKSNISFQCFYSGNVGDVLPFAPLGGQCDEYLENTVYYTFTVPVTANDYYVHFGSSSQCSQQPNNVAFMIFDGLDCNDSKNSSRIACNKTAINGLIPSADWSYDGGGGGATFITGNTYYIVADGTRQSQCGFCILIGRGPANPVLPAEFTFFEGHAKAYGNVLEWRTRIEESIQSFEVERSFNGEVFETLGSVKSEGSVDQGADYTFLDRSPGAGTSYYRIRTTDINGVESSSRTIQLTRELSGTDLINVYPQPASDILYIALSTAEATKANIQLFDLKGKLVREMGASVQAGVQELRLEVDGLSQGLYLLNVRVHNQRFQRKVILR